MTQHPGFLLRGRIIQHTKYVAKRGRGHIFLKDHSIVSCSARDPGFQEGPAGTRGACREECAPQCGDH
jgi:hypothetical protein